MKFNLKNRPRFDDMPIDVREPIHGLMEKWFEGFEKELQEQAQQLAELSHKKEDITIQMGKLSIHFSQSERWSILVKINEILGDEK